MEISIWNSKNDLCCPRCGSDTTQSLAHYVQTETVSNDGYILGAATKTPLRSALVTAATHSRSVNVIAKANPAPRRIVAPVYLILGIILALPASAFSPFLGAIVFGLGLFGMIKADKFNQEVFPERLAAYNAKWLCQRCGAIFVPSIVHY